MILTKSRDVFLLRIGTPMSFFLLIRGLTFRALVSPYNNFNISLGLKLDYDVILNGILQ